ncbi:phage portal protein BeeE [Pseudarthrobacter oxydans]|uniref:Phage portal protein BeeE n=1 Tax=Pseudarthrobacter oxydans TaxID=1671 RepID=A0AAW8NBD1_PSEOX|nr:hypothetical protein [Pseudarthrobacter oxydans]MDR6794848.1 phage portal protein BeeE [Pseudarthrobacter oxydans]MDR7164821.1 phage portal protein BeeE [Pseudarthrobacter oxydans]
MGKMSEIDIDLQDLLATIETVNADYDIFNPDSHDALEGRAILYSRMVSLGWLSPTERSVALDHFNRGDGKPLLSLLGGLQVA